MAPLLWLAFVLIRKIIYKCSDVCLFYRTAFVVSGTIWDPVNRFNHTGCVTFVSPTDRLKSTRNQSVIHFSGFLGVVILLFGVI